MNSSMHDDIAETLVTRQQIQDKVRQLGQDITTHFQKLEAEEITFICITNGAILFAADLMREIDLHMRLDCLRISSYKNADTSFDEPEILYEFKADIQNKHVLLVDDILDTGKTLIKAIKHLNELKPKSLATCVLLDRKDRREVVCHPDFAGFHIPDDWVVGYGLDFAERYRNLPYIGIINQAIQQNPYWVEG